MKSNNSLRDIILSEENIYKAIYCLKSYIFEKGLLDKDDLEKFYKLKDKFDWQTIDVVIRDCRDKIRKVLDNPNEFFTTKVYFKLKKLDKDENGKSKIVYRPLHTASLVDQISMVSMLIPLMYDDSSGVRTLSELSKMIPADFYGNLPGSGMENLFRPWISAYKAYSDSIIESCREFQRTNRYHTELTLDIKNFFPSVSPTFIREYAKSKLSFIFADPEDVDTLDVVLHKLLVQEIQADNLRGWEEAYYGGKVQKKNGKFFTLGLAQGLPQAYLFGNLCMVKIREKLLQLDDFKDCKAFFYVDDSVIYIKQRYDKEQFQKTIATINEAVAEIKSPEDEDYRIKFHEFGKSQFCPIEEADRSIAGLGPLKRNVSMASACIFSNTDDVEDRYSMKKLELISNLIDDEIKRLEKTGVVEGSDNFEVKENIYESRLKLLKRYKRFYLFRMRSLDLRLMSEISNLATVDFKERFKVEKIMPGILAGNKEELVKEWFATYEGEIFQTEGRMLISKLARGEAEDLKNSLIQFELNLTEGTRGDEKYLYFSKDFESALYMKKLFSDPYFSISRSIRGELPPNKTLSSLSRKSNFELFVAGLAALRKGVKNHDRTTDGDLSPLIKGYMRFVFLNSDEFVRFILNAYYSIQNGMVANDEKTFIPSATIGLKYTELRILSRLRNRQFDFSGFVKALENIDARDLDNRMNIDMGLLEVIGIFIDYVKDPNLVDNIILTHRVVKGLWYNGSKFMNSYTLHNEEHAVTLIKSVIKIQKAIDFLNIKQTDFYLLFLACYLHDISMVIHPNIRGFASGGSESRNIISDFIVKAHKEIQDLADTSEDDGEKAFKEVGNLLVEQFDKVFKYFSDKIRRSHPYDSAQMIRTWKDSVLKYIRLSDLNNVALISESHGYDRDEVYWQKSSAHDSLISEKYMMILIRLADLMDVANDRINYNLLRQNVNHMDKTSQFHWISHLITDEIKIMPTYEADSCEDTPIGERKIDERLNFNIYVNVAYLEGTPQMCGVCIMKHPLDEEIVELREEDEGYNGMMLEVFRNESYRRESCPMLCRWMVTKQDYFIKELKDLNEYLNAANDRWFNSHIRFNILYKKVYNLPQDLYDSVSEYIK